MYTKIILTIGPFFENIWAHWVPQRVLVVGTSEDCKSNDGGDYEICNSCWDAQFKAAFIPPRLSFGSFGNASGLPTQ